MKGFSGYDEFWDVPDEKQLKCVQQALKDLKEETGGSVIHRSEDEDFPLLYLSLSHRDRAFRVIVDASFGDVQVQMRMHNRRGVLAVHRNRDIDKGYASLDPQWDPVDITNRRLFLGEHTFMDEPLVELSSMSELLKEMPADFEQDVTGFMKDFDIKYLLYDSLLLDAQCEKDVIQKEITDYVPKMLDFMVEQGRLFEDGPHQFVALKPKVYIQGNPAVTMPAGLTTCRYCQSLVLTDRHEKCINCGASLERS